MGDDVDGGDVACNDYPSVEGREGYYWVEGGVGFKGFGEVEMRRTPCSPFVVPLLLPSHHASRVWL